MNSTVEQTPPLSVEPPSRQIFWILRILDFIIAAIFIYAGVLKIIEPVQFARDIDDRMPEPWSPVVRTR